MKNNSIETIMGAVVLVIAGFFLAFAYKNSGLKNDFNSHYMAKFDRVDGLQVGSEVRISGVKVGSIADITVDPKTFLAHVKLLLKDSVQLPEDSSAEIVTDGFLGGKYMALIPGGDDNYLKSGQEITYTQSSVSLEAMIGQLIFSGKKDKDDAGSKDDEPVDSHQNPANRQNKNGDDNMNVNSKDGLDDDSDDDTQPEVSDASGLNQSALSAGDGSERTDMNADANLNQAPDNSCNDTRTAPTTPDVVSVP